MQRLNNHTQAEQGIMSNQKLTLSELKELRKTKKKLNKPTRDRKTKRMILDTINN